MLDIIISKQIKITVFSFFFAETIFPPVFGRRLQAQVVKKGDRLIMEVEVTGTPEPTITWHKDNMPIESILKSSYRTKTQGNCHTLIIDKGNGSF